MLSVKRIINGSINVIFAALSAPSENVSVKLNTAVYANVVFNEK